MTTKQGDLALLNDPIAQSLLQAKIPARLAYVWPDGTPRVDPVWTHWNGQKIIIGTVPGIPKLKALAQNPKVALTIDTEAFPAKVLMIRGTARVEMVDELPEYAAMATRYLGEEGGQAWNGPSWGPVFATGPDNRATGMGRNIGFRKTVPERNRGGEAINQLPQAV